MAPPVWTAAFLTFLAMIGLPIFTVQVPALVEYPNLLAQAHAVSHHDQNEFLSSTLLIEYEFSPNIMGYLLVGAAAELIDTHLSGKLYLFLLLTSLALAPSVLHRAAFGRWSLAPLAAFPLLFNQILVHGLLGHLLGLALTLWGFAAWICLRAAHPLIRLGVSLGFTLALFASYVTALGLYAMVLTAYEAWHWRVHGPGTRRQLAVELTVLGLPFLAALALVALTVPAPGPVGGWPDWTVASKLTALQGVFHTYFTAADLVYGAAVVLLLLVGMWRGDLRPHPILGPLLLVGGLILLGMPSGPPNGVTVEQQLPVGLAFLALGLIQLASPNVGVRLAFLSIISLLVLTRMLMIHMAWQYLDRVYADFLYSFEALPHGCRLLTATAHDADRVAPLRRPFLFATSLALVERSCLVPAAFADRAHVPARPHAPDRTLAADTARIPDLRTLQTTARMPEAATTRYWHDWSRRYDYLYLLFAEPGFPNPMPQHLTLIYQGVDFQLYRISETRPYTP